MHNRFLLLSLAFACASVVSAQAADAPSPAQPKPPAGFHGWEGLRVLPMEDYCPDFIAADLDGSGRSTLVALNPSRRRLDLFRWVPPQARKAAKTPEANHPNALPAAPDFERVGVPLDTPPLSVVAANFDPKGGPPALFVLTTLPNRVQQLNRTKDGKWEVFAAWDLLPGEWGGHAQCLLRYRDRLLVSMRNGIQVIDPRPGTRATWLRAAQDTSRTAWQAVDLDGDGIPDLLEYTRQNDQALRWHKGVKSQAQVGQAGLLAPRVIRERQMEGLALLEGTGTLFTLESAGEGPVQRLRLAPGESGPVGKQTPLALPEAARGMTAGLRVDGHATLAVVDPAQPQVSLFQLEESGWQTARDFPVLPGIEAMIAPVAQPGTLLFKVKDTDGLFVSTWDGARMTYPAALADNAEGKVVGLGQTGTTAWWVLRRSDGDGRLVLKVWPAGQKKPVETVFKGAFDKADRAAWAGGDRLLVLDQYAPAPRLVQPGAPGQPAKETSAAHLTQALMDELLLIPDGAPSPARLTAGVVQFLGDDLKPVDQAMLPDGLAITGYAPDPAGRGGFALAGSAQRIFRLETELNAGKNSLPKAAGSWRVALGAKGLQADPALGLMLTTGTGVAHLAKGADLVLKADATLDAAAGQPAGAPDPAIHRLMSADLTGDGKEELLTCDDERHLLTAFDANLVPWLSWPVFTDQKYPYSGGPRHGGGENLAREPRQAVGADLDGDHAQDLVLSCHDRLVIYLAKDTEKDPEKKPSAAAAKP